MTDTLTFSTRSPRIGLPLLFSGQSQKETTVNEALLLADILLQPVVEGLAQTPPAAPLEGKCWIVGSGATGLFAGQDDKVAAWSGGGWRFTPPFDGMQIFDRTRGARRIFLGGWRIASAPAAVTGGTVVDTQARAALASLVGLLKDLGIFSAT